LTRGGNINCNDPSDTDATIGMDLGKTKGSAGLKSGGEFGIFGTHIYNCNTGISMWNVSNLNYYGIMEQTSGGYHGTGILIDGDIAGKPTKNIIAGSMDEFVKGVVLQGTAPPQYTRILANISNIDPINGAAIIASGSSLSTAAIFTPVNFAAGVGGAAIGSQLPDLTIPEEAPPPSPVTGSRRIYVDNTSGAGDDLTAKKADGSAVDLESGLRNYQAALSAVQGSLLIFKTVFTFSVPSIPAGKGIRVKAFWQCATCTTAAKTFSWKFGATPTAYSSYTTNTTDLTSAEVTIFNNPNSQTQQTMFVAPIIQDTSLLSAGTVASPSETTSGAVTLELRFQAASSEYITPMGLIVEAVQ